MAADSTTATGGDAIAILMSDHEAIKGLFDQLLGGDATSRAHILQQLKPLLVVHNATEENLIYPAIHEASQRPRHANGLYRQQDEAQVAFWKLLMLDPGNAEFLRESADLRDALIAHVREEEEHEFIHLREALAPQAMQRLTADVLSFRADFGRTLTM